MTHAGACVFAPTLFRLIRVRSGARREICARVGEDGVEWDGKGRQLRAALKFVVSNPRGVSVNNPPYPIQWKRFAEKMRRLKHAAPSSVPALTFEMTSNCNGILFSAFLLALQSKLKIIPLKIAPKMRLARALPACARFERLEACPRMRNGPMAVTASTPPLKALVR